LEALNYLRITKALHSERTGKNVLNLVVELLNGVGYGAIGATPVSVGTGSAIGVVSGEMGGATSCFD